MHKKLLAVGMLLCTSCGQSGPVQEQKDEKEEVVLDYSITSNDQIKWNEVFTQGEARYLVYFYSNYCGYCRSIKEEILNYYLLNKDKIYFVDSIEQKAVYNSPAEKTMGVKNIDDFYIVGTPTLVEITNWMVTNLYVGADNIKLYIQQ